jgi:transposase-like protein/IS1 family transposase
MVCHNCKIKAKKSGMFRSGVNMIQRYRCKQCKRTFSEEQNRPLGDMRIPMAKAVMALQLLLEGCAVASVERVTGLHKRTILDLMVLAGERCERLMEKLIKDVPVRDVAIDEVWQFVGCHDRVLQRRGIMDETKGSKWAYVAIERNSKVVLSWHLGERNEQDTIIFCEKLSYATSGKYQVSADGWPCYPFALSLTLGDRISFAQQVKTYADSDHFDTRYSPRKVTKIRQKAIFGRPDMDRVSTSHVERFNLELRMMVRRLTRLTLSYSKKLSNHRSMLALAIAFHNFCRYHQTLRATPCMAQGITKTIWSIEDLLTVNV